MDDVFALDHSRLASDWQFSGLAARLGKYSRIDSRESFNAYCRDAILAWRELYPASVGETSGEFAALAKQVARGGEGVIQTGWGGVAVTLHEPPRVQKYLMIRAGGYLALEKHELKDERLEVKEGAGLLLSRRSIADPLAAQALAAGDEFHFEPRMEYCVIGTEDLLVFERSIDPKGMDQDLIFLYEPDRPPAAS